MLLTVLGVIFVALGLAIAWYGLRPLAVLPRLLRAEVRDPSSVTGADSFVVCRGVANESEQTVSSPFTGSRCLGFDFEVTERQPFGIGIPWFHARLDDGVATCPFTLDGPHGGVDIVPSTKRFSLDTESTVVTVGADERPSDRIQRFIDVRADLGPVAWWMQAIPGMGMRRYVERRIDSGEEYLVAGRTEQKHGEVALAGDLVITDRSPTGMAAARLKTAAVPIIVAVIFTSAGLWGIVA